MEARIIKNHLEHDQSSHKTAVNASSSMALLYIFLIYRDLINNEKLEEKLKDKTIEQILAHYTANEEIQKDKINELILQYEKKILNVNGIEICYQKCKEEILKNAPDNENAKKACDYLFSLADHPDENGFDNVPFFVNGKTETYNFPMKQVLTLVWLALNDDKKYEHHLVETDPKLREEEAKKHRQERLYSFYRCIEKLNKNRDCNYRNRNELLGLLNKSYQGIHLIEDEGALVLSYIQDKMNSAVIQCYQAENGDREILNNKFIIWLEENDPSKLIEYLKLDFQEGLFELFINYGVNPEDIGLNKLIEEAKSSANFSCESTVHNGLYRISALFKTLEIKNQKIANGALKIAKNFVRKINFNDEVEIKKVETFLCYFCSYRDLLKNKFMLMMAGKMSEDELNALEKTIIAYFSSVQEEKLLSEKQVPDAIQALKNAISDVKKDKMVDQIENFFLKRYVNIKELEVIQYGLLLNENFQSKVYLSDEEIAKLLILSLDKHGHHHLGPYEINRIFLHAIISPKEKWTSAFGSLLSAEDTLIDGLLPQILQFVKNNFNQDQTQIASQLKRESYPDALIQQLEYLCEEYRSNLCFEKIDKLLAEKQPLLEAMDKSEDKNNLLEEINKLSQEINKLKEERESIKNKENKRPENMLLLPAQIKTAEEWIQISQLLFKLDKKMFEDVYKRYAVKINLLLKNSKCLTEEWLSSICSLLSIPETARLSFLISTGKIKEIINTAGFTNILTLLPEEDRLVFINKYCDIIKAIIKEGDYLAKILPFLPENDRIIFITTILGDQIKNIIQNGNQLAQVLKRLPENDRITLMTVMGDRIDVILQNDEELEACLRELDPKDRLPFLTGLGGKVKDIKLMVVLDRLPSIDRLPFLTGLGDNIKDIIKDVYQLVDVLRVLPDKDWLPFLTGLDEQIKDIIKNGYQLSLVLGYIQKTNRLSFLRALGNQIKDIIKTSYELAHVFNNLPKSDRLPCLRGLWNKVKNIIESISDFVQILKILPDDERLVFITEFGVNDILKFDNELVGILRTLQKSDHLPFLTGLGDKIKDIVEYHRELALVLESLSDQDRLPFLTLLGDKIKDIITDNKQLVEVLEKLPDQDRLPFFTRLGDKIKDILKNGYELADTLENLPNKDHLPLLTGLGDKIKNLIEKHYQLLAVLRVLNDKDRLSFIMKFGDKDILKDGFELVGVLKTLQESDRLVCLKGLGNKINGIIKDGKQLAAVLKKLPEKDRLSFMKELKIGNEIELIRFLNNFDEETCKFFIKAFGSNIANIIKKEIQLEEFNFKTEKKITQRTVNLINHAYLIQNKIKKRTLEDEYFSFSSLKISFFKTFNLGKPSNVFNKKEKLKALNNLYNCLFTYSSDDNAFNSIKQKRLFALNDGETKEIYQRICNDLDIAMREPNRPGKAAVR